jgi:adenylate kinase
VPQAEALDSMLDEIGKPLDAVILPAGVRRASRRSAYGRAEKEGRADDSPEAIANRLPLSTTSSPSSSVDRYQQAGIEVIVDGEQTMDACSLRSRTRSRE